MIELSCQLLSVVADMRLAYLAVDGRGVMKVPLTREQMAELSERVGRLFVVTLAEVAPGPAEVGI
jgi:hypothetical protein